MSLPERPNLEYLKKLANDRLPASGARTPPRSLPTLSSRTMG